jgi:hypothetical protein
MVKQYTQRAWRLAITVASLAAIALTLAAGNRWHP